MTNDSIFRDYYRAWDWLQARWLEVEPTLTSEFAMRIYVLLAGVVTLGLSILIAYRLMARLQTVEEATFTYKRRGPKATRPETIERLRNELLTFRKKMWRDYLYLLAVFVICGFIIPSLALFFGGAFYDWFDPAGKAFVALNGNEIVSHPHTLDIASFVINELTHGTLMDFLEVFHIEMGKIINNPNNYTFSLAVFLYRSFVGTFAFALLFFIRRAVVIAWRMPPASELVPSAATNPA